MNRFFHALVFLAMILTACQGSSSPEKVSDIEFKLSQDDTQLYSGLVAPSAEEYLCLERSKMIRSFAGDGGTAFANLPQEMDLAKNFPAAGEQGRQNSCVGWALAYALKSFQEARELGWDLKEHVFSPAFLYNQLNEGQDKGVDLLAGMEFLREQGALPYSLMPYEEKDFRRQPGEELQKLAGGFRALGYRRIDEKNLDHLRAYLAQSEPVILVIEMHENFLRSGMRVSQAVYREARGKFLGHHAVVAVGYDDTKRQVKILNSWGRRWGQEGYAFIDYDFYPRVVKMAYLVYDTPTPYRTLAALEKADPRGHYAILNQLSMPIPNASEPQTPPEGHVGAPAAEDRVLIVPDESGIAYKGQWLRLSEPLERAEQFISKENFAYLSDLTALRQDLQFRDDVLSSGKISRMLFFADRAVPVMTHLGITFASPRHEVHRLYGRPDFSDAKMKTDTYFFHAVTEEWGGIPVTKHASLSFSYDAREYVTQMAFETLFKKVKMGQGLEEVSSQEMQSATNGSEILSSDGTLRFVVPKEFSDVKKSVWEGTGYAYFLKNPAVPEEYIAVKVFDLLPTAGAGVVDERIAADNKVYATPNARRESREMAGHVWQVVIPSVSQRRSYLMKGKKLYQIQMASNRDLDGQAWFSLFLQSLEIR